MKKNIKLSLVSCLCLIFVMCAVACQKTVSNEELYPTLKALTLSSESDGTYNGLDSTFSSFEAVVRTGNTFETYPEGYGSKTYGGRGASAENIYECDSFVEIEAALEQIREKQNDNANLKSIILVTGEITPKSETNETTQQVNYTYQIVFNSVNNFSLLGANEKAIFNGVGLNFKSSDNVIVQNITVHHPSNVLKNEKDCLEFNKCNFVWVDHCEFYNNSPINAAEKDYFDGLIDVKNESSNVTISYNYMHDSWKTSLVGSGPDDVVSTRTLTYHHNIFENCSSRMPLIRGGYAHIYNNYYKDISSAAVNARLGSKVFVENNLYENVKNPIYASIEEAPGDINQKGNVFNNCSASTSANIVWSENMQNTTDYTPNYKYILDSTNNLVSFLNNTVGVNKINVETAKGISESVVISKGIETIGEIKLDNSTFQKLRYLSEKILNVDNKTLNSISNIGVLVDAVSKYNKLEAELIDNNIDLISTTGEFSYNAKNCYETYKEVQDVSQYVKGFINKLDDLETKKNYFDQNFISLFNSSINNSDGTSLEKLDRYNNLLEIYNKYASESVLTSINIIQLNKNFIDVKNVIAKDEFVVMCDNLPTVENVALSDRKSIQEAKDKYDSFSSEQKELVPTEIINKFNAVIEKYNEITNFVGKLDLSGVAEGSTNVDSTICGDVSIGIRTIVKKDLSVAYDGETFTDAIYLGGYGNKGSKCLQFIVYKKSNISLILNSEEFAANFTLADENGVTVKTFSTENSDVVTINLENLESGEYRIFTNPGDETHKSIKAFIYAVTITPIA